MRKLLILYTILAFCLSTVSALQISTPTLSGDRNTNISTTVTITNDGSSVVTNLQLTSTADAKYKIKFENIPSSIAPGSSGVATVKGFIPNDFDSGKRSIGTITVSAGSASSGNSQNSNSSNSSNSTNFGTHNFTPQNQTPQQVTIPVGMSATSDCGGNTQSPVEPIIGQWHAGSCDSSADIEVKLPFEGSVDAGWARLHSDRLTDYWVSTVAVDCNGQSQSPPNGWHFGGKIHSGPGLCDNQIELPSADSGWIGIYSNPSAEGKLMLVIAEDKCGTVSQNVPATGVVLGKVRTGPNSCDGAPEAVSYNNVSIDAGAMYVVYLPTPQTPSNGLPVGEFESLSAAGLSGWAYDGDAPSISVDVYVDGSFWKTLMANVPRQDLVSSNKTADANHGFSYSFTQADLDALDVSKNHTFHVYAINSPQGDNPLLNGSPKLLAALVNAAPSNGTNSTNSTNSSNTGNTGSNSSNTGNPNASSSATATLFMETKDKLEIDRVKISCDKLETVNEGSTIDNVKPGQTCQLTVKVKNNFDDNTEIEDIEVEAESDSSDVDGETDDISSLDAGDSQEVTLELQIDEDADDGKVNVKITVKGVDENGAKHSDELSFKLDIERLKHDLPITKIVVSPSQADLCEDTRVDVTVYVENKGQRDEDEVAVELSVPGLGFVKKISDVSIDQDEEESVTFTIPLKSNSPFGSFQATAKSFFDNVGESHSKTANVVVAKCSDDVVVVPPQNNQNFQSSPVSEPVVVPPPRVDDIVVVPPPRPENESTSFFDSALFTGILVMANLLALTVLGVMAYGFFKKPKDPLAEQFEDDKPVQETQFKDYY
jgi:uncharacterized membrane protein